MQPSETPKGLEFVVRGAVTDEAGARAMLHRPAKPKAAGSAAAYHGGWLVVGHAPGAAAEAERLAVARAAAWAAMSPAAQASAIATGQRKPREWVADDWLKAAKKKRVAKAFSVQSAAVVCAEIARRDGWDGVEIEELAKGQPQQQQGFFA